MNSYTEITVPGIVRYRDRELQCERCPLSSGLTFVCERQRVTKFWCPNNHTSPVPQIKAKGLFEIVSTAPGRIHDR